MFGSNSSDNAQPDNNGATATADNDSALPHPSEIVAPNAPPLSDALSTTPPEPAPTDQIPAVIPDIPNGATLPTEPTPADSQASATTSTVPPADGDDLLGIKQQALQSLAPLVNELDQPPEEKFKTTMMLIQASDNAHLIQDAYAAANAIKDDKARAQALLDVVNEINYFTQQNNSEHS